MKILIVDDHEIVTYGVKSTFWSIILNMTSLPL